MTMNFYLFNHHDDNDCDVFVVASEFEQEAIHKAAIYCGFPHEFSEDEWLTIKPLDPNAPVEGDGVYCFVREDETDFSSLGRKVKPEEVKTELKSA